MNKKTFACVLAVLLSLFSLVGCAAMSRSKENVNDINNVAKNKIAETTSETSESVPENQDSTNEASAAETPETTTTLALIDRLPDNQKDAELNAALAEIRKFNKGGKTVMSDGSIIETTKNVGNLQGQSKNIPNWSLTESNESFNQREKVIAEYLKNELNLSANDTGYFTQWECTDPRINALYDDEDKGVVADYENENIYICEYETATEDVYSYLFVVRDSKDGDWRVLCHGDSYK